MSACRVRRVLSPFARRFGTLKAQEGGGVSLKELEHSVSQHYDEVDHGMVDNLWGEGNYHLGFFPHLADPSERPVSFEDAATLLTERMIDAGGIHERSRVIDFGCGRGQGTLELAQLADCEVLGIDVAEANIEQCEANVDKLTDPSVSRVAFAKASFTDLPAWMVARAPTFTHVFSQQSIIHVHEHIGDVWEQARLCLGEDGVVVVSDWVELNDGSFDNKAVRDLVYERLELTHMLTPEQYCQSLRSAGFHVAMYEDLTKHAEHASMRLAEHAASRGFADYAQVWAETGRFFADRIIGVNLVVAKKKQ